MPPDPYTTSQLMAFSGASARQLTYWAQHGILKPSIHVSTGPGTRRSYSFDDLMRLYFLMRLKEKGWSMYKIREAIVNLQAVMDDPDPLKYAMLAGGNKNILALYKTKEGGRHLIEALTAGGQQVLPIALETLEEETRGALMRFACSGK